MTATEMRTEILKQLMKAAGVKDGGAMAIVLDSFEATGVLTISAPKAGPWAEVADEVSRPKATPVPGAGRTSPSIEGIPKSKDTH